MYTAFAAVDRLTLLVQRMLDADALCAAEGDALLTEAAVARLSLEFGDTVAAHHHVAQVARLLEALVSSNTLTRADGKAALEITRCILTENCDGTELTPRGEEEPSVTPVVTQ